MVNERKELLQNMVVQALLITMQRAISKLGFMPDACGDSVKEILAGDDTSAIIALGCYIEDSCKNESWDPLVSGLKKIKEARGVI